MTRRDQFVGRMVSEMLTIIFIKEKIFLSDCPLNFLIFFSLGGDLLHDFRGATHDYILAELDRRKPDLKTQLVWIGAQKEPGITARTWRWVNGN